MVIALTMTSVMEKLHMTDVIPNRGSRMATTAGLEQLKQLLTMGTEHGARRGQCNRHVAHGTTTCMVFAAATGE